MDKSESRKENRNGQKRRFDPKLLKKGLRCDLDQYGRLKGRSENGDEGIKGWNEWRTENLEEDIWLEGADLYCKHLKGADLAFAYLKEANLSWANLKGGRFYRAHLEAARLTRSHLEGVNLSFAHLEGAQLINTHLEGSDFRGSIVDGLTLFWECFVDPKTDLRGVGLESCRMDEGTRYLLEYNNRRMNWEEWYPKHPFLRWPSWLFWLISDYGLSTARIIAIFFGAAFIFANIYYHWGRIAPPGIVDNVFVDRSGVGVSWWLVPLRALYFSIITMTLGFSDMYTNAHSIWGHILITIQALLGYVLLGALVTLFAVLFTAGGPAGKFADEKKEEATEGTEKHRENR